MVRKRSTAKTTVKAKAVKKTVVKAKSVTKKKAAVKAAPKSSSAKPVATEQHKLALKLDYQFADPSLLETALTHRSKHSINNERLEFLGDSVLGFVIAAQLFRQFPKGKEGQLSRARATLVKGETLAKLGRQLELGNYLYMGPGELKSGGYRRNSILADAMEAIVGAVYLDGGIEAAEKLILCLFAEHLQNLTLEEVSKDPKTRLQEFLQSKKLSLPKYKVVATHGSDHEQQFEVTCTTESLNQPTHGTGNSRRKAEQNAATRALELLSQQ